MRIALWARYIHTKFLAREAGGRRTRDKEDLHLAHRQNESYRTNVVIPGKHIRGTQKWRSPPLRPVECIC